MQPCSLKGYKTAGCWNWRFDQKIVLLDPGAHFFESTLICKTILSRSLSLTFSSFAALWATWMYSTSFERSDSYLLGFSLKIGVTALLSWYISAQRYDTYPILCWHRANQTSLAFFKILERSWPVTSVFCFESVEKCLNYLLCKNFEPF